MPGPGMDHAARRARAADACRASGIAALLLAPGADLTYLSGYRIAHSSERLTCLVLRSDGRATGVVPELEAPRAQAAAPDLALATWSETDDPFALAASLIELPGDVGVSNEMWAAFLLRLQDRLAGRTFRPASTITRALRIRKDPREIEALRAVSAAADRAYARAVGLPFAGRTERAVATDIAGLLREEGHEEVSFTIVAAGPDGASPHHASGDRVIGEEDVVVLDFGGTRAHYGSDITRTVHVGPRPSGEATQVHDIVRRALEAGYRAARGGAPAQAVDAAARTVIAEAGYGAAFIHRTGHGIGLDGHEDPYLVRGNVEPLEPGMAFSIEPGIYLPGRFGVRIEDIAVLGPDGRAEPLNRADHALAVVR